MYLSIERLPGYYNCEKKEYEQGEMYPAGRCNCSVIIFVMSGILRFSEEDEIIELTTGEYYIQQEGFMHEGNVKCDTPVFYSIEFPGDFKPNDGISIRGTFDIETFEKPLTALYEAEFSGGMTFFKKVSVFLDLLDSLYKNANHTHTNTLAYKVAKYIHRNFKSNITMQEIEKEFMYSQSYLTNEFKEEFGVTPYQYIKKLRLDASRHMMINTNKSIEQIAFDCGYTNFTTYYRNFTEIFGNSPSAWRKSMSQRKDKEN